MKKNNVNMSKTVVIMIVVSLLVSGVLIVNFNIKSRAAVSALKAKAEIEKREECEIKGSTIGMPDNLKNSLFSSLSYLLRPTFSGSAYMECGEEPVLTYVFRDYEMDKSGEWKFVIERISVVPPGGKPPKAVQDEPME